MARFTTTINSCHLFIVSPASMVNRYPQTGKSEAERCQLPKQEPSIVTDDPAEIILAG